MHGAKKKNMDDVTLCFVVLLGLLCVLYCSSLYTETDCMEADAHFSNVHPLPSVPHAVQCGT